MHLRGSRVLPCQRLQSFAPQWLVLILISNLLLPLVHAADFDLFRREEQPVEILPSSTIDNNAGQEHNGDGGLAQYLPSFLGLDRSILGRAPVPTALQNNIPQGIDIRPGDLNHWVFPKETIKQALASRALVADKNTIPHKLDLRSDVVEHSGEEDATLEERQQNNPANSETPTVFITINVCLQPSFGTQQLRNNPPQLDLWISTTEQNQNPSPSNTDNATRAPLVEGFASFEVKTKNDVYVGVSAPRADITGLRDIWNYNLAASIDGPYHGFNTTDTTLYLIDSDPSAALLVTSNLINATPAKENFTEWISRGPPLSFFAQNINDTSTNGLRYSYCGLANAAKLSVTNIDPALAFRAPINLNGGQTGITYNQPGGQLGEQQIYMPSLNTSSTYYGYLAQTGNSTAAGPGVVGGGGIVFEVMNFTTKRDPNCAVIFNLTFCSNVNYAVPANPNNYTPTELTALYDNSTQAMYKNFTYSLQQIPCNTSSSAQYSLVKNCDDCAAAYKTWLCAVTIPKCEDFTLKAGVGDQPDAYSYLMPRNVAQKPIPGFPPLTITNTTELNWLATNSSRNANLITDKIQPGPYKEVLPCEDLCYDLVKSCPAALGFSCPAAGRGLEASYGKRGVAGVGGGYKCNAPGAVYYKSGATSVIGEVPWETMILCIVVMLKYGWV